MLAAGKGCGEGLGAHRRQKKKGLGVSSEKRVDLGPQTGEREGARESYRARIWFKPLYLIITDP